MLSQAEFDAMLQRYLDGQSPVEEQRLVAQWSQQYGEPGLLLPNGQHDEVRRAMWQRIVQMTADEAVAPPPVIQPLTFWRRPALRWAAAAVLGLGLGAGWQLTHQAAIPVAVAPPRWVQRTNDQQAPQQLQLADGSHITLYKGSTLRYKTGLPGARREVHLEGQAFFKVTKNPARPFLVYTNRLITTVLGTSFLVTAYTDKPATVVVREGRVAVQTIQTAKLTSTPAQPTAATVVLLPNQQVRCSASTQHLDKTLADSPVILNPEPLTFHNRPVSEVLAALEKAYGVNIVYDPRKLKGCTITIGFDDEPLFDQLDALCKALNSSYKLANNAQIIFESTGCKSD